MSSSGTEEPPSGKRPKLNPDQTNHPETHCQHFVQRKKRFCKMTVARGKSYCGEHDVHASENADRIPCPLDPKHSVSVAKLEKHLKICNAKATDRPAFIEPGVNALSDYEDDQEGFPGGKLTDVPDGELKVAIERILKLYDESRIGMIDALLKEHPAFKKELSNESYGPQTLKHLVQSASLLGIIEHEQFLRSETAFVEFGAGKGQVAFWLATILQQSALTNTKVLLVDRASHRHKKDNKIEDRELIQRVRADIADLVLDKLELPSAIRNVVGVGKHLCGGATDLALRCLIRSSQQSRGFVFALCCHHRCDWKTYTGKRFLLEAGLGRKEFELMVRMVSWAVCGTGTSRERRKDVEGEGGDDTAAVKYGLTRAQREDIGRKCKRVLDAGRLRYLERNGFEAGLKFYASSEITLENVCMIGHVKNKD